MLETELALHAKSNERDEAYKLTERRDEMRMEKKFIAEKRRLLLAARYDIYEAMHHGPTMAHNTLGEEKGGPRGEAVCMCATCAHTPRAPRIPGGSIVSEAGR